MKFRESQRAILKTKKLFEKNLSAALSLQKVTCPFFLTENSYNDTLDGLQRPVQFDCKNGQKGEILHSLAKWKRALISKHNFPKGEGIVVDMLAIRRDDDLSQLHSYLVDQWDWEVVISKEEKTLDFLYIIVREIFVALKRTESELIETYPYLKRKLPSEITFITSQELENLYPEMTIDEREYAISKKFKAVFISQIGEKLHSGIVHSIRSPDYDDWKINGDIIVYNQKMDCAMELSSMGVRVDEIVIKEQLEKCSINKYSEYHKRLINKEYLQTIGGGIGQSRVALFFLEGSHISDIQAQTEFT